MGEAPTSKATAVQLAILAVLPWPVIWFLLVFYRGAFFPPGMEVPQNVNQWLDWLVIAAFPALVFHAVVQVRLIARDRFNASLVATTTIGLLLPLGVMGVAAYAHYGVGA